MRERGSSQRIDRGISVIADRGISVITDGSVVTNNISLILSHHLFFKERIMNEFEIARQEAQKIRETIELLNINGLEHHLANRILQIELERCETRMWLHAPCREA